MDKKAVDGYKKLAVLVFLFVAVAIFRSVAFDVVTVVGDSMNNTYFEDDLLIVKANTSEIEKNDVVVAKVEGQKIIKRVIAKPYDTVYINGGKVYVNGVKVEGEFDFPTEEAGVASESYTLAEDEYFLMGDNRNHSKDSRDFGGVNIKDIKGIVMLKI